MFHSLSLPSYLNLAALLNLAMFLFYSIQPIQSTMSTPKSDWGGRSLVVF
jgi:hypothetical protein